jgi:hypothetical protein
VCHRTSEEDSQDAVHWRKLKATLRSAQALATRRLLRLACSCFNQKYVVPSTQMPVEEYGGGRFIEPEFEEVEQVSDVNSQGS